MADIAKLVIEIDSSGVVSGRAELDKLTEAGKRSEDQVKKQKTSYTELNQALELARKGFALLKGAVLESITEFVEAERAQIKLEAVLRATGQAAGRTSQQLNDMANALAGKTIFDDDAITNAQALLLTFKHIGGEVYDRTVPAVADLASAFGMDLSGAAVMLGKALEDPATGLTALRRVGVSFTEQEQEQIKALNEAGEAAKAQGVILDALKGQVGGVAEAMGASASGSIARMENAVNNLQEAFGRMIATDFMPLIKSITDVMDLFSGKKVDLFWGGFVDAKDPSDAIRELSGSQLKSLLEQIDKVQSGSLGAFGGKTGVLEQASMGKIGALEKLIQARIDKLEDIALRRLATGLGGGSGATGTGDTTDYSPYSMGYGPRDDLTSVGLLAEKNALRQKQIILNAILSANQASYSQGAGSSDWDAEALAMFAARDAGTVLDPVRAANQGAYNGRNPVEQWDSQTTAILSLKDALGLTYDQAEQLADAFDAMEKAAQGIAAQGLAQGFQDMGAAMATGGDGAQAFGQAMAMMGVQIAEQIGAMMIAVGLKMMLEPGGTLNPMAWAMVLGGGGMSFASGAIGSQVGSGSGSRSVNDAIITKDGQVIETHPDDNLYAFKSLPGAGQGGGGPMKVSVHNYAGAQIETREKQGPTGRELEVIVKNMVAGQIASGQHDKVAGARWGVGYSGRSSS